LEGRIEPDVNIFLLEIRISQGLRHPLALIIAGTRANRIDVAPIVFVLGIDLWITINF
jgi:hypothetical protein